MNESERQEFERRSRAAFEASVAGLEGATRSRLVRARQAAIGEIRRRPAVFPGWVPAGAVAAAAVLAVTLWFSRETRAPAALPTPFEDLELLATGEDFEMLDEDAAFYAWAAGQATDAAG
ncbi:MAG: hypothetical protein FJ191_02345 [Gammaproteobacteria bacterium]|nr:hypothetical protein [Gammaproteobacteria bacterium]